MPIGISVQKKSVHAAEQDRPDVVERRRQWAQQTERIDPSRLVFLDESGAKTNMTRTYGWALGGQRVIEAVPHGHWHTTTMLAAIRVEGVIPEACLALEGAINGAVFEQYVREMLAPALQPGDIVVMDNLASHKGKGIAEAIEAAGAHLWYLPPYSPDLNPIERMWSKIKSLLKKTKARAQTSLYRAIGMALQTVSAAELAHYYAAAGYAISE
jgi:transposase